MFRRNQNDTLPSTMHGTGVGSGGGFRSPFRGGGGGGGSLDGSGRSIKMDAPVVKAWKKSSGYTRWSYYIFIFALSLVFFGFRSMRYWNASIWLTCHGMTCTLEITPPGTRTKTVVFPRSKLLSAQGILTDKEGNYISTDTTRFEPSEPRKTKKKYKQSRPQNWSRKGPDGEGRYATYRIKFVEDPNSKDHVDFSEVREFFESAPDRNMASLQFRQFTMGQSRMRIRSQVNKIESYTKKRRQKLIIKETADLPWQGILCLVFGLVGTLLTLLIGQFYDEEPRRHIGPGVRRSQQRNSGTRMSSRPSLSGNRPRRSKP